MGKFRQSLRRIPYWAYTLVVTVIFVNTVYLLYLDRAPVSGETSTLVNGHYIIDYIAEGSPVGKTEIKTGDTLVSCNGYPLAEWFASYHGQKAGDTLIFGILRNNRLVGVPVIIEPYHAVESGYALTIFIFSILFSISSLYLLVKKPLEKAARLFFIYLQLLAICGANAVFLQFPEIISVMANVAFIFTVSFYGTVLVHFHIVFPKPALFYQKFRQLPAVFYSAGAIVALILSVFYIRWVYLRSEETDAAFMMAIRYSLFWAFSIFLAALFIAVYQYLTIKNTLARNQTLLLVIGSFFVFLPLVALTFFYDWFTRIPWPYTLELSSASGNLILVLCILFAISRYRIWDMEVFIRKALLYLAATAFILLLYLGGIWLVGQFVSRESELTRFLVFGISVILFLVLRDRIQRLIDRIFHRETYDSARVVSGFEEKLSGVYRMEDLKQKIVKGLDDIFHFKSFVFILKRTGLTYEPAFVLGVNDRQIGSTSEVSQEFEEKLRRSKVFSPEELSLNPPLLEMSSTELIVPMVTDDQVNGFFLCGPKRSEKTYSQQDIRVLSTLARRVVSLLHTANLYQKDLDRQLMLERERARISQDMHDDVGASLTRISILSELAKNNSDTGGETRQWLGQISDTSRGVMEEMSQIIWALNPKNDTLEGLMAYIRRFANEYLEPTSIACRFNLPDTLPDLPLTVEVRRNIYLVVREALHNVVKHSGATEVVINLTPGLLSPSTSPPNPQPSSTSPPSPLSYKERGSKGERSFIISIRDNGKGFDPDKLELSGNGLVNMKKRMTDISGEVDIRSHADHGTIISLVFTHVKPAK